MRTSESSTRKLPGIEKLTEYTLATETGELAFFIIKPTNIACCPRAASPSACRRWSIWSSKSSNLFFQQRLMLSIITFNECIPTIC